MLASKEKPDLYLDELIGIQRKTLELSENNAKIFTHLSKKNSFPTREYILLIIVAINCFCSLITLFGLR